MRLRLPARKQDRPGRWRSAPFHGPRSRSGGRCSSSPACPLVSRTRPYWGPREQFPRSAARGSKRASPSTARRSSRPLVDPDEPSFGETLKPVQAQPDLLGGRPLPSPRRRRDIGRQARVPVGRHRAPRRPEARHPAGTGKAGEVSRAVQGAGRVPLQAGPGPSCVVRPRAQAALRRPEREPQAQPLYLARL